MTLNVPFYFQAYEVTSSPKGPTSTTAPVTINIQDVNDETPTFSQNFYNATVAENTQARIPITFMPFNTEMVVRDFDQVRLKGFYFKKYLLTCMM